MTRPSNSKFIALVFLLTLLSAARMFASTVVGVAIAPQGAVLQNGSSLNFSATCTYSDGSTDNCSNGGGVTWSVSRPSGMSVSSTGTAKVTADPGTNSFQTGFVMATVGGTTDRAAVYAQHAGDTWYQYMTPDYRAFKTFMQAQLPTSAVVGSTIALGSGVLINYNGSGSTGNPLQPTCNWSSSAPNVATVDRQGHVTAVSVGSAVITCGRAGNGKFGSSTQSGWQAPGNVITITVVNGGTSNQTWYVRPAGGTPFVNASTTPNGQCDGLHDADYPGTGVNQPCAVGNLSYLWLDQVSYAKVGWMISGGDTVIVRQKTGGYGIGATTSNGQPNCPGDTADCYMPAIPSGTAARHTRILGENYGSCHVDSAKTKLLMDYGQYGGINLQESQFADVACFEVTDSEACAYGNFTHACGNGGQHFGGNGVLTSALTASDNVTDLFIHGLAAGGFLGAVGTGVVVDHLHLRAMPSAGINMDDDPWATGNISVAGGFALTNSITEFTGCVEEYPVVHNYPYIECRDQSTGGYGDGLGTASTSGDWLFDHDVWRFNFQDGLDLLHSGMHSLTVTNSQSYGNDGQQYKIGSGQTVVFANNIALHDCQRILQLFGDEPASAIVPGVTACRAAGDGILLAVSALGSDTFQNNTYVGYGSTSYDMFCEDGYDTCTSAHTTFENNINLGLYKPSYNEQLPGLFYNAVAGMPANGGWAVRDHNVFYNFRNGCPTLNAGEICADPAFTNEPSLTLGTSDTGLDTFNFNLSSASPAKYAGAVLPTLSVQSAGVTLTNILAVDQLGTTRHNPPSMGALEIGGNTSSGSAAPVSTSLGLSVTPVSATAGTTVTLTGTATANGQTPNGTVTFTIGGSTLTGALNSSGTATATISTLPAGSYTAGASYSGSSAFASSASAPVAVTVTAAGTTPPPPPPPPSSNVSISVAEPTYGFNVIPNSVRRIFATVTNGSTNGVNWTVKSGGGTISASTGPWVDVTAPTAGSSCTANRTVSGSVTSGTQFVIEATSQDDATKVADVTFNVCSPTVQVSIVPAYRTLYAGQSADLQSVVVGSVQSGVTWAIQSQPQGGDGSLSDAGFRDTVFTGSVAGRYVITATSVADGSTVASTTMYVTGHAMPYQVTQNFTEPVDCSVDPALTGTTYDVGPSQMYHHLANVPLGTLLPGSTIRLHNEDQTGQSPTVYNEAIQITTAAQPDQPVRVCGVPDSAGNLPIMDGTGAAMHPSVRPGTAGLALIAVGGNGQFLAYPNYSAVQNVVVEGVHLRNARGGMSYMNAAGGSGAWSNGASCLLVQAGHQISVTGVEMEGCSRGGQSLWVAGQWNGSSLNHLWEGNYIHGNGTAGSIANHQLALQAWGEVVQFNRIDGIVSGSAGADLKSRGVLDVIRYNYLGDGAAHTLDLAEVFLGSPYLSFASYMAMPSGWMGQFTPDSVAAWQEALHTEFVYGNTYLNGSSSQPIHFGYDILAGEVARKGNLFWYNNTFHQTACPGCNGRPWTLFDQNGLGGSRLSQVEFPTVDAVNNLVWMDTLPFQWNDFDAFIGVGGTNLLTAGWGRDTLQGGTGDGWNSASSAAAYQGASNLALHISGFTTSDVSTASTMPFSATSWLLSLAEPGGSNVPPAIAAMPTRFAYLPASGYAIPRVSTPNIGAEDTATQASAFEQQRTAKK